MGEEAPVPPWILQTQATLGTIVKKPRLTDNLLKKPPFRFLHDVVSEVTRQTGFPDQLFPEEEMIGKAIKDKETKLSYLNKLVCCIGNALGSPVNVNPKKIVAGHEPEKTNGMLQALYEVATGDPAAAQQAVQRTLAGETPAGVAPLGPPPQFGSAGGRPQSSSKAKRSDPPAPAPAPPPAQTSEPVFPEAPPQAAEPEKPRRRQRKPPQQQDEAPAPPAQQPPPPGHHGPPGGGAPDDRQEFVPPNRNSLPERPQTARRAPPKVKSNEVPVDRPPSGNPGGGGRGASDVPGSAGRERGAPLVIGEGEDSDDDDGMVIEAAPAAAEPAATKQEEHGGLVSNLMEAQKAQEEHAAAVSPDAGPGGGRPGSGGGIIIQRRIGKREGKGHYGGEVASLRESLQKLCQCTNPLGKTMDYIQEDLDNMHKELESWKTERRKLSNELNDKSTDFEKMMQPLADKKLKVAQEVAEMKEKIVSMKTQIATNDEKIEKMLAMVVSAN